MPVTPNGTSYTTYPFTSSAGEAAWRTVADARVGASGIPTVLFCHGNPGAVVTDADQQFAAGYTTLRNDLIDDGWAYIEGHGAGANWGNQAGRTAYEAMYADTAAVWSLGKLDIIGRSMGALVAAYLASQSPVTSPHVAGFVSLSGTADLSNRYSTASAGDRTNMNAAFGVTDDASWRAAVAAFDPMLAPLDVWDGRNAIMQWDTGDTTVPYAINGQAWDTKYGPRLALRRTSVTTGGDHNSTPNNATQIAATIAFLQDAELPVTPGGDYHLIEWDGTKRTVLTPIEWDGTTKTTLTLLDQP
ncbi:esterase [Microbacterium phage Fizzles]|nr:esterase [Microbacterium phage Fizzles]